MEGVRNSCIKVDYENHEALAYLTGWISNEINKFYYKISAND